MNHKLNLKKQLACIYTNNFFSGLRITDAVWVALLAARQVARTRSAHTLDNVAMLLEAWKEKGLVTVEAVETHLAEVRALNARIRALMERAGRSGGINQGNRELLRVWRDEWHMPDALVDLAADYARGMDKPMPYMNRLLESWRGAGVSTVEEAREEHERFQAQAAARAEKPAPGGSKRVIEQNYEQRAYDPSEDDELSPEQLEEMSRL